MSAILKFNAGFVVYDDETRLCTPHPIKGEISIKPSEEGEGFYDFVWAAKEKTTEVENDELLVIPGDVTWKQAKSCQSGRVFVLTFLSSGAKYLYWFQDVGDDEDLSKLTKKDIEITEKINKLFAEAAEEEEQPPVKEEEESQPLLQPIYEISDVITPAVLLSHLDSLSDEQLMPFYEFLPPSMEHTRNDLRNVLTSGLYQASSHKLSSALKRGAGSVVSQSLDYPYAGEGVENYLNGTRSGEKKKEEKK